MGTTKVRVQLRKLNGFWQCRTVAPEGGSALGTAFRIFSAVVAKPLDAKSTQVAIFPGAKQCCSVTGLGEYFQICLNQPMDFRNATLWIYVSPFKQLLFRWRINASRTGTVVSKPQIVELHPINPKKHNRHWCRTLLMWPSFQDNSRWRGSYKVSISLCTTTAVGYSGHVWDSISWRKPSGKAKYRLKNSFVPRMKQNVSYRIE